MKKIRGFTLIELLVVVAIIGILSSIVVTGLQDAKASSRDAKRVSDIKNIQLSLALYYNDNGHYPCLIYGSISSAPCQPDFSPGWMETVPTNSGAQYTYASFVSAPGSTNCTAASKVVESYHLGAPMEVAGSNLTVQDRDATTTTYTTACNPGGAAQFYGNATNCTGTTNAAADACYDVIPNY